MFPIVRVAAVTLSLFAALPAHAQQNPSFNLINRGGVPIRQLFFTPAGDANWGRNRLEGREIPAGSNYAARRRLDGNCIFDIRVVFADGRTEDRRNIDTCRIEDIAFGAARPVAAGVKPPDDPSFKLINRGSAPIEALFVVPAGQGHGNGWGANRLGGGALQAQTDEVVHPGPRGQCRWDLKIMVAGQGKEKHNADLCRITELPFP